MLKLENLKSKEEIMKEYFCWLFEKSDIKLIKEIDYTLCSTYYDPYILSRRN